SSVRLHRGGSELASSGLTVVGPRELRRGSPAWSVVLYDKGRESLQPEAEEQLRFEIRLWKRALRRSQFVAKAAGQSLRSLADISGEVLEHVGLAFWNRLGLGTCVSSRTGAMDGLEASGISPQDQLKLGGLLLWQSVGRDLPGLHAQTLRKLQRRLTTVGVGSLSQVDGDTW